VSDSADRFEEYLAEGEQACERQHFSDARTCFTLALSCIADDPRCVRLERLIHQCDVELQAHPLVSTGIE
jgi:hypothetical protein